MQVPKNQWKFPDPLNSSNIGDAAEWNKGWMTDKINQGYDVVDIGLDPHRDAKRGRSPFYAKELEALSETKGSGKRWKLKKFPDGESVKDMRARLNGCH